MIRVGHQLTWGDQLDGIARIVEDSPQLDDEQPARRKRRAGGQDGPPRVRGEVVVDAPAAKVDRRGSQIDQLCPLRAGNGGGQKLVDQDDRAARVCGRQRRSGANDQGAGENQCGDEAAWHRHLLAAGG
jgi:hypothetical protein